MGTLHIFVGPTITEDEVREIVPDAEIHPPIQHGDLFAVAPGQGDTAIIIDGLWHQVAPIRHKEILHYLDQGVKIFGAGSMGALRAAELYAFGMRGIGKVFEGYKSGRFTRDDEVAVTQVAGASSSLTTALVDIRATVEHACRLGIIDDRTAEAFTAAAQSLPYQSRIWRLIEQEARSSISGSSVIESGTWKRLSAHALSVKAEDARLCLRTAIADRMHPQFPSVLAPNGFAREWNARFTPTAGKQPLPWLAILQHEQLYNEEFQYRWGDRVLRWISGHPVNELDPCVPAIHKRLAIQKAEQRGITLRNLSVHQQTSYWLSESEQSELPEEDALARILVRSCRVDASSPAWPARPAEGYDLVPLPERAAARVSECYRANDRAYARSKAYAIGNLRREVLEQHLAVAWSTSVSPAGLTAAARDRGLRGLTGAIEVARQFYLLERSGPKVGVN